MKSSKTLRRDTFKKQLTELITKFPEAGKIENRYKLLKATLKQEWLNFMSLHDQDVMEKFIQDVIYVDRMARKVTEGEENEEKEILSQKFQIEELNMEPGANVKFKI